MCVLHDCENTADIPQLRHDMTSYATVITQPMFNHPLIPRTCFITFHSTGIMLLLTLLCLDAFKEIQTV